MKRVKVNELWFECKDGYQHKGTHKCAGGPISRDGTKDGEKVRLVYRCVCPCHRAVAANSTATQGLREEPQKGQGGGIEV